MLFIICIVSSLYINTDAGAIRTLHKRSSELENVRNTMVDSSQMKEGTSFPSQSNGFPFLLPYWWHYLRPMLQVALQNTNFRYMLQKEYEHEIELNPANEDPIEIENTVEVDIEMPNENTAIDQIENTFESMFREPPEIDGDLSSFINAETGGQELEHAIETGTERREPETLEHDNNLFNKNEAENTEVLETSLTGEFDGIRDGIVEMEHNAGGTLELTEAETHSTNGLIDDAMIWNINSVSGNTGEMKHSEEDTDHGGQFQIGFQNHEFQNDRQEISSGISSQDVQDESTSVNNFNMFMNAESTTLSNSDHDNSDHNVDSYSGAMFTTPMNVLPHTFDQHVNDQDSSS